MKQLLSLLKIGLLAIATSQDIIIPIFIQLRLERTMLGQFSISFPNQILFFFGTLRDLIDQPCDHILAPVKLLREDLRIFADLRLEGLMVLLVDFFFQIQKVLFFST